MASTMSNQPKPMTDAALAVWAQLATERAGQDVTIRASALDELVGEIKRLKAKNQHVDSHAYGHLECCREIYELMHERYGELVPLPKCATPKVWANRERTP